MPEVDGLSVVRRLRKSRMPLVAFVTADDEDAVRAFELNAVDYLLKPVSRARLQETLNRARAQLELSDWRAQEADRAQAAAAEYEAATRPPQLERIPIRRHDEIVLLPVKEVASVVAVGELLRITTAHNETYTLAYRLKDLAARLDAKRFVRLSRGALANMEMLSRVGSMFGGAYLATLTTASS